MKYNYILTWIALVALTLLTFYSSEASYSGKNLIIIVMSIAIIKFLGIGFQFMEVKKANIIWKIFYVGFIAIISLIAVIIV